MGCLAVCVPEVKHHVLREGGHAGAALGSERAMFVTACHTPLRLALTPDGGLHNFELQQHKE